uniref:Fatty acyl-CoA reductase n=1 Tax=Spermophilus dauricus TaxID=99837 RepID=A0A8C9P748_SPEDA
MSMIAAFYDNKSILITGATGFLGKVLMEKLFRTTPDLKVVYILVRPKAGQTLQQRVFQILNSKVCLRGRSLSYIYENLNFLLSHIFF